MNPYDAVGLDWDEQNTEHLLHPRQPEGGRVVRPSIQPWQVEEILENRPVFVANRTSGSGDYKMIGRPFGGPILTIVVQCLEETRELRPITGWRATEGETTIYEKRRGKGR